MLREGKTKNITIYLDGDIYNAEVINTDYNDEIELNRLKITYSENSDLYNKFKILYKSSYEDYLYRKKGKKYLSIGPLDEKKEYISVYAIKNNHTTKHLGIYHVEAGYKTIFNDCTIIGRNQINTYFESFGDIEELICDISSEQCKKDNWKSYIIKFHEVWRKRDRNNLLNFGGKYIWGKKVQIDPDRRIEDIFNRNIDHNTVQFFNAKNKSFIGEIEEADLIQLIYYKNFEFVDFRGTIGSLFIKNKNIGETEMNGNIMVGSEENGIIFTLEDAENSANKIKNELNIFSDIINYYDAKVIRLNEIVNSRNNTIIQLNNVINTQDSSIAELNNMVNSRDISIAQLNNIINSRDIVIAQLNNKINLRNQEIITLRNTVKELEELNKSMQCLEELEEVKANLKEIKSLLEEYSTL